jgi:hypothetical protein
MTREYLKGCATLVLLEIKCYEHRWHDYACELKIKFKFEDLSDTRINKKKPPGQFTMITSEFSLCV